MNSETFMVRNNWNSSGSFHLYKCNIHREKWRHLTGRSFSSVGLSISRAVMGINEE